MHSRLVFDAVGMTHAGMVRETNEDNFAVVESQGLFLLADGMGGRAAGEIASRIAIETIRDFFGDPDSTLPTAIDPGSSPLHVEQSLPLLIAGIQLANGRIFSAARRDRHKRGMGTTLAAVLIRSGHIAIAHVGDSRVYRFRKGHLELLTRDHSLLNECLRLGHVLPSQAEAFPLQHVITRALGTSEAVDVETRVDDIQEGDVLLICSDGLHGPVDEDEIIDILHTHHAVTDAANQLIERANTHGGPDNVTCILVKCNEIMVDDASADEGI